MKRAKIKVGVSPLSWMNSDMPELGSHIPKEQCLIDASAIGYEGIELEDPFRAIMETFPQLLKKYNLSLAAGWHSTFLLEKEYTVELDRLKEHMELLSSLGSHTVNLAECSGAIHREKKRLSTRPLLSNDAMKALAEKLDALARYMEGEGFTSAYHHHMGTVVQDLRDIDLLMENSSTLGLLFDSGHLRYAGECPTAALKKHLGRVTHVHCKNVRPSKLKEKIDGDAHFFSSIADGAFTVPGDSSDSGSSAAIDFQAIVELLKADGYEGWIIVEAEQDPRIAHPYTYAKLGYDTICSYL